MIIHYHNIALKDFHQKAYFNEKVTSKEIIDELGFGWNLGNTFDAWETELDQGLDSETCWENPKTSPELIDFLVKSGFKVNISNKKESDIQKKIMNILKKTL